MPVGDGEAPVVPEFKHLGSVLSENFDDSVTIMARIRLARIAFTKLQGAIFGTSLRRVALESKEVCLRAGSCSGCFYMARNAGLLLLRT
jgi:hypothetical protein